ncbi:MAG: PEP-CTERM sorting domain-containing protein [Patescibacteria group bacterium]|nr:PEP-CTERM sorting domain-containing protein [Patescibacteria group bacterium]
MTLHVWDRIHCRWRVWRGTLKAWKALPHAIVGATCTITVGSIVAYHLHVESVVPPVPVQPVPKSVYTAGIGYLNPWHSFEVDATPPWVGVPAHERCDHDKDDPKWCKKRPPTVPEPAPLALMLGGLGAIFIARRRA